MRTYIHTYIYSLSLYIYIYICREREGHIYIYREREIYIERERLPSLVFCSASPRQARREPRAGGCAQADEVTRSYC